MANSLRKDIKAHLSRASSQDKHKKVASHSKIKEWALKAWLESKFPFTYGVGVSHETCNLLIKAISESDLAMKHGLWGYKKNALTTFAFVEALMGISRLENLTMPYAPIIKIGTFLPMLKVAHSSILKITKMDGVITKPKFMKKILRLALTVFYVIFFPSHT